MVEAMEVEGDNKGEDEVNENKKIRRGGRRGARGRGKKKLATKDPQLKEMLLCMAKLTLSNSQKSRIAMASLSDTFLIPHDLAVVQAYEGIQQTFTEQVRLQREKVAAGESPVLLGSPAPHFFIAVVEKIGSLDIGALNKQKVAAQLLEWNQSSEQPLELKEVIVCRIDDTKDDTKNRLSVTVHHLSQC